MKFIQGNNRNQMAFFCLEQAIDANNDVRLIDAFVDKLPLDDFGFKTGFTDNGRPAYHPCDLLKLFLYGYLNRIRSSRVLEKECTRNLEVMWLMKGLRPDHKTISNFISQKSTKGKPSLILLFKLYIQAAIFKSFLTKISCNSKNHHSKIKSE